MDNWTGYSNISERSGKERPPLPPLRRMTEDRLYRWADFRILLNSDFCHDIVRRETNDMPPLHRFRDIDNLISKFMADPVVTNVGGALRNTFCKTHDALRGNAYFIFGIPRVQRFSTEIYSCYDVAPTKVEHSENRDMENRTPES